MHQGPQGVALAAKKAQGVRLGGLNAKGIANREEALERAEQLRPVFAELAGMSHRKMAAELNARKIPTPAGGQSLIPLLNFRLARPKHLVDIRRNFLEAGGAVNH